MDLLQEEYTLDWDSVAVSELIHLCDYFQLRYDLVAKALIFSLDCKYAVNYETYDYVSLIYQLHRTQRQKSLLDISLASA